MLIALIIMGFALFTVCVLYVCHVESTANYIADLEAEISDLRRAALCASPAITKLMGVTARHHAATAKGYDLPFNVIDSVPYYGD